MQEGAMQMRLSGVRRTGGSAPSKLAMVVFAAAGIAGAAQVTPAPVSAGGGEHIVVAFPIDRVQAATAMTAAGNAGLTLDHPLFRGHADWNIWDVRTTSGMSAATG